MRSVGILAGLVIFSGISAVAAQQQSDIDTVRAVDSWAGPGDSVSIPIWLVNTFNVSGVTFRITFDRNILKPVRVDIAGTRCEGIYNYFGIQIDTIGGWCYWFGLNFTDPRNNYIPPGTGTVAEVVCWVRSTASLGSQTDIQFVDDVSSGYITSLSDQEGFMTIPVKDNGIFTVSTVEPNYPPEIQPVRDTTVIPGQTLTFPVSAQDPNGDTLTLRGENLPANATFPPVSGDSSVVSTFTFTPSYAQAGMAYTVRFIATDDPGLADTLNVQIDVTAVANYPPAFQPIPGGTVQSVKEGEVLSFAVRAHDPDGDSLCITASNLPANASFPEVCGDSVASGTFTFSPDFTQGPDTIQITFHARDELGATTNQRVDVIVIDVPYDIIIADTTGGGLPGATQAPFSIELLNADSVYGLQFDLHYDENIITLDDVAATGRLLNFVISHNMGDTVGMVRVVVFSYDLAKIAPGQGPIMDFSCSVTPGAPAGPTPLTLSDAIDVIDIYGTEREMLMQHGFFTVDTLGDVTLNLNVSVGDVVALVSYILGRISFNARQLACADVNEDGNINVGDVVGIVNIIMGRPVAPPLAPSGDYLAEVSLSREDPLGQELSVLLSPKVPIAGIQLRLDYNPAQVEFSQPVSTEITESFTLESQDDGGRLTLLLYNFSGAVVPDGDWTVVKLPLRKGNAGTVRLVEAVLADTIARVIPTRISGETVDEIPVGVSLRQNYPNPFRNSTRIYYAIPSSAGDGRVNQHVTLKIYNAAGSLVNTLVDGEISPGVYSVEWDGTDGHGMGVSSGIYFYNLKSDSFSVTKKMMVLR